MVDVPMYLQIEPEWARYATRNDPNEVARAKAVGLTQTPPGKPRPGSVIVKLTVRLPRAVFVALQPEAVVVIPATMVQGVPVVVEATDPREGDDA